MSVNDTGRSLAIDTFTANPVLDDENNCYSTRSILASSNSRSVRSASQFWPCFIAGRPMSSMLAALFLQAAIIGVTQWDER